MPRRNALPSYRHHKPSGNAVVTLCGRDIYLGPHDTRLSHDNYDRVVAEWLAAGRVTPRDAQSALSIAELVNGFRKGASIPQSQTDSFKATMSVLVRLYGRSPANEFGPLALKAVRQQMIESGWNRRTINDRTHIVRRIFRWGVEQELIPGSILHALGAVSGLKAGQSDAPEPKAVQPVAVEHVEACLPHMPVMVADMVRLQMLTGMRPGELVIMRSGDIDTSGTTWVYRPSRHKTLHIGKSREIALGPQAIQIAQRYLKPQTTAFLFSPADSEQQRRDEAHARRKTPLGQGNRPGTNCQDVREFADHYDVPAYRLAIYRAADAAFPVPEAIARARGENEGQWKRRLAHRWNEVLAWREKHRWHPHQLRHTFATCVRKRFGLDHAQRALGHAHAKVTETYAQVGLEKAMEVAQAIG